MNVSSLEGAAQAAASSEVFDPVAYINTPTWQASRYGLDRIRELLQRLGNPQRAMRIVHVAGTNGKGSTCAFTESILRQAGYATGLFTSPYIITFNERIRIAGQNITDAALRTATLAVRDVAETMAEHPTEFELMTAVAFVAFAAAGVEVAVVEVGLGGRLDSTNVVESPEVCAITPIALDHTALLGNTLAEIAAEKAAIIKPGCTAIMGVQDPQAAEVIRARATEVGVPLTEVAAEGLAETQLVGVQQDGVQRFNYKGAKYSTRLLGSYQPQNAACAIEIATALAARGFAITPDHVREGIATAEWPGRFQLVAHNPDFIVDGGHNPQGAAALAQSLQAAYPGKQAAFLISVLADKDHRPMLRTVLPFAAAVVCAQPPNPRALPTEDLAAEVREVLAELNLPHVPVEEQAHFTQAVPRVQALAAQQTGLAVAFGSLYSLASIMNALL